MIEELKVTSPEEYAKKAEAVRAVDTSFLHKLKKTGAVVRLRRVDMQALSLIGAVPMSMVKGAIELAEGDGEDEEKEQPKDLKPTPQKIKDGNSNLIFLRQTVVENCLEPRIAHEEGIGVFFVGANGKPVARVDPDDFTEMFNVITGIGGADGLDSFRNRKERRASTAKLRSGKVRTRSVSTANKRQPAKA